MWHKKFTYTQDCTLQHELEKDSILSDLLNLQKEVSTLSSSSLMKEKESVRRELDRTKTKLRETENKLKNSIQEKIKLQVGYQLIGIINFIATLKASCF